MAGGERGWGILWEPKEEGVLTRFEASLEQCVDSHERFDSTGRKGDGGSRSANGTGAFVEIEEKEKHETMSRTDHRRGRAIRFASGLEKRGWNKL